jgi:hypothetical protein
MLTVSIGKKEDTGLTRAERRYEFKERLKKVRRSSKAAACPAGWLWQETTVQNHFFTARRNGTADMRAFRREVRQGTALHEHDLRVIR